MGCFKDAEELYRFLGGLFDQMAADDRFREADTVIQVRYSDPDAVITMRVRPSEPGRVDRGATDLDPEVLIEMGADLAHNYWLGEFDLTVALARGEVDARGPVEKVLKLVPLTVPLFAAYRESLERAGRTDLFV